MSQKIILGMTYDFKIQRNRLHKIWGAIVPGFNYGIITPKKNYKNKKTNLARLGYGQ